MGIAYGTWSSVLRMAIVLAEGDFAFTARGRARIVQEPMTSARDYAAVAIDAEQIDDHRQAAFVVESGIGRRWIDESEKTALGERVGALRQLASEHLAPSVVA